MMFGMVAELKTIEQRLLDNARIRPDETVDIFLFLDRIARDIKFINEILNAMDKAAA
jgi:hypothetical protein